MNLERDISPDEVARLMAAGNIVLVDVREPQEYAGARIRGALLFPLSTFDPHALPAPSGRPVVFHCGSGKRSLSAIQACAEAGIAHTSHMQGGIQAWIMAGQPVITIDPATGRIQEGVRQ